MYESQFITLQHTSGHVKCSTVHDQNAQPTLLYTSFGIDSINFLTLFRGIVRHSCCSNYQSWSRVWGGGWSWRTRLFKWFQRCAFGFKSGELEGHGSTLMLFCSTQSIVKRAVCDLALSCWNNFLCWSITCMKWGWRISSLYLTAVKLPWRCTSSALLSFEIAAHIMTLHPL